MNNKQKDILLKLKMGLSDALRTSINVMHAKFTFVPGSNIPLHLGMIN